MRKWLILIVVAAVLIGGGAYYGMVVYPQKQLEASLQRQLKRLPDGITASYKTAHYAVATSTLELGGVAIHVAGEPPFDITADAIEASRPTLDLDARWRTAVANPAALTPETALPIAGSIVVRGVTVRAASGGGTLERFRMDGVRIYPWALVQKGAPSVAEAMQQFAKLSENAGKPLQPDDLLAILRTEAALVLAYGHDGYVAENLSMRVHVPEMANPAAMPGIVVPPGAEAQQPATLPAMDVTYSIRKMTDAGMDRGTAKQGAVEGITFDFKPLGAAAIDHATVSGLDMRKPLTAVLSGAPLALEMLDGLALDKIEYGGMSMQYQDKNFTLGTASISAIKFDHGLPVSAGFAYNGLHLTKAQFAANPQAASAFDQLGLEALTFSVGAAYQWDPEQKRLAVKDTVFKIDELGSLTLTADLVDIAPSPDWQQEARLAHLVLRYDDASLAQRGLKAYAKMNGVANPEALRQQLTAMVDQQAQAPALAGSPPIIAALAAVKGFVGTPKSLTIELAPPSPVPLATLQGAAAIAPPDLATLVGLQVTSNK